MRIDATATTKKFAGFAKLARRKALEKAAAAPAGTGDSNKTPKAADAQPESGATITLNVLKKSAEEAAARTRHAVRPSHPLCMHSSGTPSHLRRLSCTGGAATAAASGRA